MLEEESTSCFGVDDTSMMDAIDSKGFFADFDLDEMSALEEGDLSLLSDPQKVRQLAEALSISPPNYSKPVHLQSQMHGSCSSSLPSDIFNNELSDKDGPFDNKNNSSSPTINNNSKMFLDNNIANNDGINEKNIKSQSMDDNGQPLPPALPPVVISPADIDSITVQLEKNQQCACKDCGKLFNSVWYLKQHAVKHSNDRPFKCKFCMKTYKFRSNLYQHKCPERNRHMGGVGQSFKKKFYTRGIAYTEMYNGKGMDSEGNPIKFRSTKNRHKNSGESSGSAAVAAAAANSSSGFDINPFLDSQSNPHMSGASIFGSGQEGNCSGYTGQTVMGSSNSFDMQSPRYPVMPSSQLQNMFFESNLVKNTELPEDNTSLGSANHNNNNLISSQYEDPFCTPDNYQNTQFEQNTNTNFGLSDYCNSIREKPLDQEYIDNYIQKNRHRIYTCRKCKLSFPSREHLSRHNAYHTSLDCQPFVCDQCPQRFSSEKQLSGHYLQHSDNSPHRCGQCYGTFRSALALRRHKDQSRQCYYPPFGVQPKLMISPSAPLDQFSFVDSEEEDEQSIERQDNHCQAPNNHLLPNNSSILISSSGHVEESLPRKSTTDSGVGSDCSGHSFTTSPLRAMAFEEDHAQISGIGMYNSQSSQLNLVNIKTERLEEEEEEEELEPPRVNLKTELGHSHHFQSLNRRDDETDSGFRSRLNSLATTTQSCSPPSSSVSSASDGGSPSHKAKVSPPGMGHHQNYGIKYSSFNAYSNAIGGGVSTTRYNDSKTNYGSNYTAAEDASKVFEEQEWRFFQGGFGKDDRGDTCLMSVSSIDRSNFNVPMKGIFGINDNRIHLSCSSLWDWDNLEQHSSATDSYCNCSDAQEFEWERSEENRSQETQAKVQRQEDIVKEAVQMFLRHLLSVLISALVHKALLAKNEHVKDHIGAKVPVHSVDLTNSHQSSSGKQAYRQRGEVALEASSHKTSYSSASICSSVMAAEEKEDEELEGSILTNLSDCHISGGK